jgi:AcrR family transcriptional regulator
MPKIVDHDNRKREILEKALELFSLGGFHASSFAEIAELRGLSRTNMYNYFKSKEEIFFYAVEDIFNRISVEIDKIARQKNVSVIRKLSSIYEIFADNSAIGRYSFIITELAQKIKNENVEFLAKLQEAAKALRQKIESLLYREGNPILAPQVPVIVTLFFSLVESSISHSLFIDKGFIQNNIASLLNLESFA